jgi:hypothetical protein
LPFKRKPKIVIRPAIPEWDERPGDYEELVSALRARGVNARLADHKGIPSGSDIPALIPEAFAVFIAAKLTDALLASVIDDLTRLIVRRAQAKWWRKGGRARGVIYGPKGDVLHEFVIKADDP